MADFCPKCGQPAEADYLFCPKCGALLTRTSLVSLVHSSVTEVSGVLGILSSCDAGIFGILTIVGIAITAVLGRVESYSPYYTTEINAGILAAIAFPFGLIGSIFALRRTHFELVVLGFALLIIESFYTALVAGDSNSVLASLFGVPVLAMSLIGIIFAGVRKSEFR